MKIKDFNTWLNEDFATVGVAPAGNISGMGDVAAPAGDAAGSGDAWPSLGAPSSLSPLALKRRRKRKTKKLKSRSSQ